jgi:DNA invertase Pin-like site-specific DNA recombinase
MAHKVKRVALYRRVSTDGQTTENQRLALEAVAEQRAWTVIATYSDNGISGAKGRAKQPGLDRLLKDAGRPQFNVVMAWAMDRLGRSLADLIDTLRTLEAGHVDLSLHQQTIDTTTPAGRMFFHVTGAFAEFERNMIRTRVNAGLARARARGVRLGRPNVSRKVEISTALCWTFWCKTAETAQLPSVLQASIAWVAVQATTPRHGQPAQLWRRSASDPARCSTSDEQVLEQSSREFASTHSTTRATDAEVQISQPGTAVLVSTRDPITVTSGRGATWPQPAIDAFARGRSGLGDRRPASIEQRDGARSPSDFPHMSPHRLTWQCRSCCR